MKATSIVHRVFALIILPLLVCVLAFAPKPAAAQDYAYQNPDEIYSREELAQMLAPVALYPDSLLSQVLMASTYPIEVIEADRWLKRHSGLQGTSLDDALLDRDWDPSVKALCHFPSILSLMSERIGETTDLGNAFLAQEPEVMAMIQELRARARAEGHLVSNAQQTVVVERETIIIQPVNPRVVYVPYYDPYYIYGSWWYPAYPPWYWGPSGVTIGIGLFYWPGFYFSYVYTPWSHFDWHRHTIFVEVQKRPRYVRYERWYDKAGPWHHAPHHRRGVAYRDKSTAVKYGQSHYRGDDYRRDRRGYPEGRDTDRSDGRRFEERRRTEERTRATEGSRTERQRREEPRVEQDRRDSERSRQQVTDRNRQGREAAERERRERTVTERQRPETRRIEEQLREAERNRQQQNLDRERRQQQERVERQRPERAASERQRQESQRFEGERRAQEQQLRERAVREQQTRQGSEQQRQPRQRVETESRQRSPDNVFNRVEQGRQERQSSERGRSSRQDQSSGNRDDWGRNRR